MSMPKEWVDLLEGLALLSTRSAGEASPLHCEHGQLIVMADPADFTPEELARLSELGFYPSFEYEGAFASTRFGSA